ncbi:zinc ribbon domain-containing protein [Halobium palmae]|uniref:Zinc ribbon domain-containing protein n=1 Tax=Halobium palmae TaxID=1776492 RepID=A0ABD5S4E5_9EURY
MDESSTSPSGGDREASAERDPNVDRDSTSGRERGPDEVYCRNCAAVISERAEICPDCGVRQRAPPKSSLEPALDDLLEGGNPFVAAVASALVPGLGQLYNRQLTKGLVLLVAGFLAGLSMAVFVGFLLYPVVWVYAVYDAYTVAARQTPPLSFDDGA